MIPSSQLPNAATAESAVFPSDSTDANCTDYFSSSVYEFHDIDETGSTHSFGYQKPKHIWMAKGQTLSTTLKLSSPSAVHPPVEFVTTYLITNPVCSSVHSCVDNIDNAVPGSSFVTSPTHSADVSCSPSTIHSTHGLSLGLSSSLTNTSSSHTPPVSVTGLSTLDSVSSCASPNSNDLPVRNMTTAEPPVSASDNQNGSHSVHSPVTSLETVPVSTIPKRTTSKIGRKRTTTEGTTSVSTSYNSTTDGPLNGRPRKTRRRRTTRGARSDAAVKSSCVSSSKTLKLKLPIASILKCSPTDLTTDDLASHLLETNDASFGSEGSTSKPHCTLQSQSPLGIGGLKIRLRRDFAPLDSSSRHGIKRLKHTSDSSGTFRIVESWCDADAPGGEYSRRHSSVASTSSSPVLGSANRSFRVGDIVWAKLAGYPYWPSRISAIWARTAPQMSQATPLPPDQGTDTSSLAVLATPSDPNLATGYTARVDWLAGDQFSYLSCAKLYPFKEAFDKMYNPRTRVKGYTEAVRIARRCTTTTTTDDAHFESHLHSGLSPNLKAHFIPSAQASAPPSTDSHWSTTNTLPCSLDPPSVVSNPTSKDYVDKDISSVLLPERPTTMIPGSDECEPSVLHTKQVDVQPSPNFSVAFGLCDEAVGLSAVGGLSHWAPLPQLDISGLGDFASHVPTFSEDEDEIDGSLASHLQIDFSPCL